MVSEHYDEVVFTDPTNAMYNVLTNPKPLVPQIKHEADVNCEWRYTAGGKECMGACQVELHHVCVQRFRVMQSCNSFPDGGQSLPRLQACVSVYKTSLYPR